MSERLVERDRRQPHVAIDLKRSAGWPTGVQTARFGPVHIDDSDVVGLETVRDPDGLVEELHLAARRRAVDVGDDGVGRRIDHYDLSKVRYADPDAFVGRQDRLRSPFTGRPDLDRGDRFIRGRVDACDRAGAVIRYPDCPVGDGDSFGICPVGISASTAPVSNSTRRTTLPSKSGIHAASCPMSKRNPIPRHRKFLHDTVRVGIDPIQHLIRGHDRPHGIVRDETAVDMVCDRNRRRRLDRRAASIRHRCAHTVRCPLCVRRGRCRPRGRR